MIEIFIDDQYKDSICINDESFNSLIKKYVYKMVIKSSQLIIFYQTI